MARLHPAPVLLAVGLAIAPVAPSVAQAAAAPAKSAAAKPARASVLPFIADDLDRALAEAKRRDLPLFIESWAPW